MAFALILSKIYFLRLPNFSVESVSDSPNGKREKERMLLPKMRGAAWARNLLRKAGKVRGRVVRLQANLTRAGKQSISQRS